MQKTRVSTAASQVPDCSIPVTDLLHLVAADEHGKHVPMEALARLRRSIPDRDLAAGWQALGSGATSTGVAMLACLPGPAPRDDQVIMAAARAAKLCEHHAPMGVVLDLTRGAGPLWRPSEHNLSVYRLERHPELRSFIAETAAERPLDGPRDLLALSYAAQVGPQPLADFTTTRVAAAVQHCTPDDFSLVAQHFATPSGSPEARATLRSVGRLFDTAVATREQCQAALHGSPERGRASMSSAWIAVANARRQMSDREAIAMVDALAPPESDYQGDDRGVRVAFLAIAPADARQRDDEAILAAGQRVFGTDDRNEYMIASLWPVHRERIGANGVGDGLSGAIVADHLLDRGHLGPVGSAMVAFAFDRRYEDLVPDTDGRFSGRTIEEWEAPVRQAAALLPPCRSRAVLLATATRAGIWIPGEDLAMDLFAGSRHAIALVQAKAGQKPTEAMAERCKKRGLVLAMFDAGGEQLIKALRAAPDDVRRALVAGMMERMGTEPMSQERHLRAIARISS